MAKTIYSKFCIYCEKEFDSYDRNKKFCNLACSTANKNKNERAKKLLHYNLNPKLCLYCTSHIHYDKRYNDFCSVSCSAFFNNSKKDWSKIKTGPPKGTVPKNYYPYTKIKQCVICSKWFSGTRKTCSDKCKSILLSNNLKGKTGGNRDANIPYYDSYNKFCYLDSYWELKVANSLDKHNIKWSRPNKFILSDGRSYTPDFYLVDYNIYLDPKALRPNYYRSSKLKVQQFEQEFNTKCMIITKEQYLHWFHIQTMLLLQLHWS